MPPINPAAKGLADIIPGGAPPPTGQPTSRAAPKSWAELKALTDEYDAANQAEDKRHNDAVGRGEDPGERRNPMGWGADEMEALPGWVAPQGYDRTQVRASDTSGWGPNPNSGPGPPPPNTAPPPPPPTPVVGGSTGGSLEGLGQEGTDSGANTQSTQFMGSNMGANPNLGRRLPLSGLKGLSGRLY